MIDKRDGNEVLTERELCAVQVRAGHGRFTRSLRTTLEEARDIGAWLNRAYRTFSDKEIQAGAYRRWFKSNCADIMSYGHANQLRRIDREWETLVGADDMHPKSVSQAIRMLSASKTEQPEQDPKSQEEGDPEDAANVVEPLKFYMMPDGSFASAEESIRAWRDMVKKKEADRENLHSDMTMQLEKHQERIRHLENQIRDNVSTSKNTISTEKVQDNLKAELLRMREEYAKLYGQFVCVYNEEPEVTIEDLPGEVLAKFIEDAPSYRLQEATATLSRLADMIEAIGNFKPEELANAAFEFPQPADYIRRMAKIRDLLNDVIQHYRDRTEGRLRLQLVDSKEEKA